MVFQHEIDPLEEAKKIFRGMAFNAQNNVSYGSSKKCYTLDMG